MSTLTKTLLAVAATMLVAGGAYAATAPKGNAPAPALRAADVKGPCDEAEHADRPALRGRPGAGGQRQTTRSIASQPGDEVEHHEAATNDNEADDVGDDNPGEAERHDNRGPGSMNSGPGNAEDRGDDRRRRRTTPGRAPDDSGHSESGHSGSGSLRLRRLGLG